MPSRNGALALLCECHNEPIGKNGICRGKAREAARRYRAKHPEKAREFRTRHYWANREKRRAENKAYYAVTYDKRRDTDLKKKYGITLDDYNAMLEAQGGVCAICGNTCTTGKSLAVDHCHATGRVRGLLCGVCNRVLGYMKDDVALFRRAAEYLETSDAK